MRSMSGRLALGGTTEGIAEQGDVLHSSTTLHHAHDLSEIMIHISIKPPPPVSVAWRKPICEIDGKPLPCQTLYDAAASVQVENKGAFHEGIDEDERRGVRCPDRRVITQPHASAFIDDSKRSYRRWIIRKSRGEYVLRFRRVSPVNRATFPLERFVSGVRHSNPVSLAIQKQDHRWEIIQATFRWLREEREKV
jgi:hypothetical protein